MVVLFLTTVSAQASLRRGTDANSADKPSKSAVLSLRNMPGVDKSGWPPMPDEEDENLGLPPIEEHLPAEPDSEDPPPIPPTFFGEIVPEQFVFLIDTSGSMESPAGATSEMEDADGNVMNSPSRLQLIKQELLKMIADLPDGYEFDLVVFPGINVPTRAWKGALVVANDATRAAAAAWVEGLVASGGTPMSSALEEITSNYPEDIIDKMFVLCDGFFQHPSAFPAWWKSFRDNGCEFIGVHIGSSGAEAMMKLVATVGGKYKQVG